MGDRISKKAKPTSSLERDFSRANYSEIIKKTLDSPSGKRSEIRSQDVEYVVGALTYLGRLDEAQWLFDRTHSGLSLDALCASRFYLGMAHCRQADYKKATAHFIENLKVSKNSKNQKNLFHAAMGVGFYRYFCGRYRDALLAGKRALRAAHEMDYLYGKFLASDLMGHALIQTGQISGGIKMLEEALADSKKLGNGEIDEAVRISFGCYNAQFGNAPASDLETLQTLLENLAPQDTYSRSALLLELGRQFAIRGKLSRSQNVLNQACRLIYSSSHRRQSVLLNLRYAYNLMLAGENHQALNLIRTAAKGFDPRVDKALEVQVLGLEYRLKCLLSLSCDNDPLKKRLAYLTRYTGMGTARKILCRADHPDGQSNIKGEDPMGDLFDLAARKDIKTLAEILSSGYLVLLYSLLPLIPGESSLYLDLSPGSLLIAHQGNLEFQPQGISPILKSLLLKLSRAECSKEQLIREVWGYEYDPLRHDSLIYPAISRLRQLLGERAHWIEVTHQGYRLKSSVQVRFFESEQKQDSLLLDLQNLVPAPTSILDQLNFRQIRVLKSSKEEPSWNVQTYKQHFQVSQITATRDLTALHLLGLVKRIGKGRATRYLGLSTLYFEGLDIKPSSQREKIT